MRYHILGPLNVVDGDRAIVLTGRRRTVLGVLLADAGHVVSLDDLVDAVWADAPPATARRQIQNDVSALRRALSDGTGREVVITDGDGYRAALLPGELDAQLFRQLVAEAGDLARDDPAAAAEKLRAALRLWRGPALLGLAGRAVEAVAVRLEEQRLAAVEDCMDVELGLDRHRDLVGELAELVAANPLRERLVGQLMLALHGCGRQPDALAAYDRLRERLADELGLDPGPPLQQLHAAILRDERVAGWPAAAPAPPAPAQLPTDVPGFTGRAGHLRRLDDLLAGPAGGKPNAVVISAIAGLGGVGKTALAVHWGHRVRNRFPDGQLYVNLRGFADDAPPVRPNEALVHLLRSLGEAPERIPADVQTAAGRYRSLLAERRVLVLLDNAADADQVRPLLPAGSGCMVLVTSRHRLTGLIALDGADSLTLDVLTPDEAHALLASILGPERVAAEPAATAELARICSHLPLALRVAAANLICQTWPDIAGYVAELRAGDRLTALDTDDDQSGVRRAFDLSYRTLPADTRPVFRLLGLVPGADVTAEAAAALAGIDPAQARRRLDRLAAAHLVSRPVFGRYVCHDLLRHYALDRCRAEDTAADLDAAAHRLHDWYLHGADTAAQMLYGHAMRLPVPVLDVRNPVVFDDGPAARAWLNAEHANLVAAIRHAAEHGPRSRAWLLADTLRGFFWLGMHLVDWQAATQAALTAAEAEGNVRAQAAARFSLGDSFYRQGSRELAIQQYEPVISLAEQVGWSQCEVAATWQLGVLYRDSGRLRAAVEFLERGLKLCRASGWQFGEAICYLNLSKTNLQLGQPAKASECCTAALALNRELGYRLGEAINLGHLGEIRQAQGRPAEAVEHVTASMSVFREIGDRTNEATALRVLAAAHGDLGDLAEAARFGQDALAQTRELGERRTEAEVLNTLGDICHRTGDHREAAGHHAGALALAEETGDRHPAAVALIGLATEHRCLGDPDTARRHAERALAIAREADYGLLEEQARAFTA